MLQKGQIQAPTLSRDGFDPTSVYRTEHHWRLRQSAPKFIVRLIGRHCSAEHYVRPCKLPYRGSLVVQRGSVFATTRRVRGICPGMAGAQVGIYEGGLVAAVLGAGAAVGAGCALPMQVSGSSAAGHAPWQHAVRLSGS